MSILKNAVDSIAIGLEDFESTDDRRIVSATRNIFAGILLLFKHRLCELSPDNSDEVLIKQKILPEMDATGAVNWIGKGKKTVDVQNIRERFKSLGIEVDWNRLERINKYRNDIEHYYSAMNHESVQQLVSDSFVIIRNFIAEQLYADPKELLGEEYWKVMVEINEVYEQEKAACEVSLETLNYASNTILDAFKKYQCQECGSGLIEAKEAGVDALEANFSCRSCDHSAQYEELVGNVLAEHFSADFYLAHTDGNDVPMIDCPSCYQGDYLIEEGVCSMCDFTAAASCMRCGGNIPPEEISESDICGYCSYMAEKIMRE
ncbi:hypothetical protein [Vibrio mediterranei]|uniref:hypothetical protein n=1 Tax=Vibrio mediterranei TaxID=689 RepID=UPI004067E422